MNRYFQNFILLIVLVSFTSCNGDDNSIASYKIGHDKLTFEDPQRNNATITAELFYPAKTNGEQTAIIDEKFPLIIFAHGYQQVYSDYHNIWEDLVSQGYIIAFLTTQQGLTINIDTYSQDIIFLHQKLNNTDETYDSIISGHTTNKSALMGHSTGGGAIYIAQESLPQNTTLISLAALGEVYGPISGTSPIDIAHNINTPSLILAGDKDCVTSIDTHQQQLYDNLNGVKVLASFIAGDHCGFSDSINCPIAEALSCGIFFQGDTMDEGEQIRFSTQLILPWLDHYLKDKSEAWSTFESFLNGDHIKYEMDLK